MSAAVQAEWVNAEKRLDIAAEDFARTTEVDFRKAARVAPAPAVEREAGWQFPWVKTAWSAAAVAALVAAGFFITRKDGTTQTAQVSPPLAVPAAAPSAATPANGGAKGAEGTSTAKAPPIAVANDSGTNAVVTPTVPDLSGAKIESEKPAARAGANGATRRTTTKHTGTENAPAVAANVATDNGAKAPAVESSSPDANSETAKAANSSEPDAVASNATRPPRAGHEFERGRRKQRWRAGGAQLVWIARDERDGGTGSGCDCERTVTAVDPTEHRDARVDRVQERYTPQRFEFCIHRKFARADHGNWIDAAGEGYGDRRRGNHSEREDGADGGTDCDSRCEVRAEGIGRCGNARFRGRRRGGGV